MTRYLVTGGCGFIGTNFIRHLIEEDQDARVTNLDALTYAGNRENLSDLEDHGRYEFIHGSITDEEAVSSALTANPDVVVHFAAESHVDRSLNDERPFVVTNVYGTQLLLQKAREYEVSLFVHVSTDEVYGSAPEGVSFSEEDRLNPSNPYAASKAGADMLVNAYQETYDFPVITTRSTNNYGPYQYPEKFIPLFITGALNDESLPLYGDGSNVRDWLFVRDHCRALRQIIENGSPGSVYNIGADCEKKNIEVARGILDVLEKPQSLIEFVEDRPGHDARYSLDCTKLREEIGWSPDVSFDSGLERTVKWYKEREEWWKPLKQGEFEDYYQQQYDLQDPQ